MTMPHDWASRKVAQVSLSTWISKEHGHAVGEVDAAKLLRAEHVRTVRTVKRLERDMMSDGHKSVYQIAYEAACQDLLAAIQKGHA